MKTMFNPDLLWCNIGHSKGNTSLLKSELTEAI